MIEEWKIKLDRKNLFKAISNCSYCSVLVPNNRKYFGIRRTYLMMRGQCLWSTGSFQVQLPPVRPTHTPNPLFPASHNCEEAWSHPPLGYFNSVPHSSPLLVFNWFPAFLLGSWFPNFAFWTFILIAAIHRNSHIDFFLESPEPDGNGCLTIWPHAFGWSSGEEGRALLRVKAPSRVNRQFVWAQYKGPGQILGLTRCSLSPSTHCLQPRFSFSPFCTHTRTSPSQVISDCNDTFAGKLNTWFWSGLNKPEPATAVPTAILGSCLPTGRALSLRHAEILPVSYLTHTLHFSQTSLSKLVLFSFKEFYSSILSYSKDGIPNQRGENDEFDYIMM